MSEQRGGEIGNRIISGGGPKPLLGRGFMVCFPPPPEVPPPCFSLLEGISKRYPEICDRPKKVLSNPPQGSIEPLKKVLSNPLLAPEKVL